MQEEIEHKTVNLAISTTKLSARTLLRGMQFLLRQYDKHASQGKQSMKRLVRQNRGVTNVEIQKTGINFSKSMRYNPMAYIHSEKDILKLVTALMTNTKGEGQGGDPFWDKAERLLLVSLIAYLHYEAPVEEQNFATLLEMLNTMQVSEDDETYQNPVDLLFEDLGKKKPKSFAVRQYKLYKLAAGVT